MKKRIAAVVFFISVLILSCTTDVGDCICTTEFVAHNVIVLNSSGDPVDSITTRITNSFGREFIPHGSYLPNGPGGRYWIIDDSYKNEFSSRPATIFFNGTKGNASVEAAFLINADDCKCHVNKVAGPDTVVIQ